MSSGARAAAARQSEKPTGDKTNLCEIFPSSTAFSKSTFDAAMTRTSVLTTSLAADARKFAVLQNPQQFHLRRKRHFADFIEKKRAAVGFFKTSLR
jgi:hypothetical protein